MNPEQHAQKLPMVKVGDSVIALFNAASVEELMAVRTACHGCGAPPHDIFQPSCGNCGTQFDAYAIRMTPPESGTEWQPPAYWEQRLNLPVFEKERRGRHSWFGYTVSATENGEHTPVMFASDSIYLLPRQKAEYLVSRNIRSNGYGVEVHADTVVAERMDFSPHGTLGSVYLLPRGWADFGTDIDIGDLYVFPGASVSLSYKSTIGRIHYAGEFPKISVPDTPSLQVVQLTIGESVQDDLGEMIDRVQSVYREIRHHYDSLKP